MQSTHFYIFKVSPIVRGLGKDVLSSFQIIYIFDILANYANFGEATVDRSVRFSFRRTASINYRFLFRFDLSSTKAESNSDELK